MSRKFSFYDLDESWYRFMAADRKTRREMCETVWEIDAMLTAVCMIGGVVLAIIALCKGWI